MLSIQLEPHYEEEWCGENFSPGTFPKESGQRPLYHQWLTAFAERPLIINAFNTGTGKTKAALLRLQQRVLAKRGVLNEAEDNVLLIAPTNELLAQHAMDAEQFCKSNGLPYRVLVMSRASLDEIERRPGFSEGTFRPGAALHAIIEDPRRTDSDDEDRGTYQATIYVVNPDIFYYALYFRYSRFDRIPLFLDIFTSCNYIIIDEFHYYNPKQFANFLFFMQISKWFGFVDGSPRRQFCLLTATPSGLVDTYLARLGFAIDRIDPATVPPAAPGLTRQVPALAPVQLEIYSRDELPSAGPGEASGFVALVERKQGQIASWLADREDGAVISSSLWRILQIYQRLQPTISADQMGRITGPEERPGRDAATRAPLILATPTVDIGYNFDKKGKPRQNIDFLFFDARSSDEFVQRLGRAGRILGKPEQSSPSRVYTVVDPAFYKALTAFDGQVMSRARLRALAESVLPPRNELYAYVESGAIAEAFLPIYHFGTIASSDQKLEVEALFDSVHALFGAEARLTYRTLSADMTHFLHCEQHYRTIDTLSRDQLDILERVIVRREQHDAPWLAGFADRLREEQSWRQRKQEPPWREPQEAYAWVLSDLRSYMIERARFSFREDFQPPLALMNDPRGLHTSAPDICDDALRVVRFYHARFFRSREDWEREVERPAREKARNAVVFCHLYALRKPDAQLHIGFTLDAGDQLRREWEGLHTSWQASRLTALYGLEIVALNSSRGVPPDIQFLLSERFIPSLVMPQRSRPAVAMQRLQKKAQFIPYPLRVAFADDEVANYWVIPGTMALQVEAELRLSIKQEKEEQKEKTES
jgi:CRISPR-associated endonuclease/helicase Cas3